MTFFEQGVEKSRQGDHAGAILDFDQALKLNSDDPEIHGHRCVARHRTGDKPGAISDCQQAAALYLSQENMKMHQYALNMLKKLQK